MRDQHEVAGAHDLVQIRVPSETGRGTWINCKLSSERKPEEGEVVSTTYFRFIPERIAFVYHKKKRYCVGYEKKTRTWYLLGSDDCEHVLRNR
jgi:hypothetical protein